MKTLFTTACATMLLSACATTQYTSGADYAARTTALYSPEPATDAALVSDSGVDADIARIAAVEPALAFPARIGIAYIDEGRIAGIPAAHQQSWAPLSERIAGRFGEVVPISPLIAGMVAEGPEPDRWRPDTSQLIANIRRGAARQHVDYVLVYEVSDTDTTKGNALKAADWSILGLFMLPSRDVEVRAAASAVLLDVRNGYPYGTASGLATKDGLATGYGANDKRRKLKGRATDAAVEALALDVDTMWTQLIETVAVEGSRMAEVAP